MSVSLSEQMNRVQLAVESATQRLPDAWAVEVFDDRAIVKMDGVHYSVTYQTDEEGAVVLAQFDDWQKVESDWQPTKSTAVSIKAITDDIVTVGGYGIIFGGKDLEGETFESDTNYMLDLVPIKMVMYDHGAAIKHFIGNAKTVTADEYGLWVEAELDRHADYVAQIEKLVKKGALGWSSGTAGHMTIRDGKSIKRWPVVEFSLTPTPAEPRTLGVDVIKHLAEADDTFAALLPEGDGKSPEQDEANTEADALRLLELDIMELEV